MFKRLKDILNEIFKDKTVRPYLYAMGLFNLFAAFYFAVIIKIILYPST